MIGLVEAHSTISKPDLLSNAWIDFGVNVYVAPSLTAPGDGETRSCHIASTNDPS